MVEEKIEEIFKRLKDHEKRIEKLEGYLSSQKLEPSKPKGLEARIKKLCDDTGINRKDFDSIFFINKSEILLITVPEGKNEAERQLKVTLATLTASVYLFNQEFMKSSIILKNLKKLGISSLVNLSTNLSEYHGLLISEGKPKSRNFGFRITFPGRKKGLETIKSLIKSK